MVKLKFDENGVLEEPCLSCKKEIVEIIDAFSGYYEWRCEQTECPYMADKEDQNEST